MPAPPQAICALNIYDELILVAEDDRLPLASIIVVEIKRPMRNDARAGEEKDPIEQALGYLERIRKGHAQTSAGRPISRSEQIPGFVMRSETLRRQLRIAANCLV